MVWWCGVCCVLSAVEVSVDVLRYGLYFGAQLLFDAVHVEAVFVCDEVQGEAQMAESTASTDAVQISLRRLRKVKVDHHITAHQHQQQPVERSGRGVLCCAAVV